LFLFGDLAVEDHVLDLFYELLLGDQQASDLIDFIAG
jgi:hypothetical protein